MEKDFTRFYKRCIYSKKRSAGIELVEDKATQRDQHLFLNSGNTQGSGLFKAKGRGFNIYISRKQVQDFLFIKKRFRILYFKRKKGQGSRILYLKRKKGQGSRILYFKKKGTGFKDFVFQKKKFKDLYFKRTRLRISKIWDRVENVIEHFFKDQVSYFGIGLKMWLRTQFSSTWLGSRVQLIFQRKGSRILYCKEKWFKNSIFERKKFKDFVFKKKTSPGYFISKKVQGFIFQKKRIKDFVLQRKMVQEFCI
eukprot:snap_masked-scaffold_33-processed-gene-1.30-mRNA-1 protein AED:1.00 eAED:1.00 QI:0/0/0/0/1/1/2/0/251